MEKIVPWLRRLLPKLSFLLAASRSLASTPNHGGSSLSPALVNCTGRRGERMRS